MSHDIPRGYQLLLCREERRSPLLPVKNNATITCVHCFGESKTVWISSPDGRVLLSPKQ
jgi:hypothetical protein